MGWVSHRVSSHVYSYRGRKEGHNTEDMNVSFRIPMIKHPDIDDVPIL